MVKGKIKAEWHQKVSAGDLVVDEEGDKPLEMRDTSREKIAEAQKPAIPEHRGVSWLQE